MEQYTTPSPSTILQRIQRIRQYRLQNSSAGIASADGKEASIFCQPSDVQVQELSMVCGHRSHKPEWKDFGDWLNAFIP